MTDKPTEIRAEDLKIDHIRAPDQFVHEADRGVRILHTPTGITATAVHLKSELANKGHALSILEEALRRGGHLGPKSEATFTPSETGGVKGKKQPQLGAIDPQALLALARVAGRGNEQLVDRVGLTPEEARYNYLRGFDWSLSFDAMQRHALAFWAGEDLDPDTGLPHMAHAAWHTLALVAFALRGIGRDDRPPK